MQRNRTTFSLENSTDRKPLVLKEALTENYVLQQIKTLYDTEPKYYAPTSTNEIDFIVQDGMNIIPIEVKAGI